MSRFIIEGRPELQNESLEDKARRLAIVDTERKQHNLRQLQKQRKKEECPFKPQIDPNSRLLAKKKQPAELAAIKEKQKRLDEKKIQRENESLKECTFRPRINNNKKFSGVESHYTGKNYDKKLEAARKKKSLEVTNFLYRKN